ncbi:phage tail tape measure protein [Candidatus Mesenet endosymbiont of Agriotes lineatus]|uniref:phage tail tape measure protein n=1 Tax=Candidatus Mesenet endosymbiont of Agriotes lineatus TaxID=3077948 RepID=UPI0030CDAB75
MSTLSIKIGAILDGSFSSTMAGSSAQLSRLGNTIKQLDLSMQSVSKFKQLTRDSLTAKKSWKDLEGQVKSLAKQIKLSENPSKALQTEFNKIKLSTSKAKAAYLHKREALYQLNLEIRKSGQNIESLVRSQLKLGASAEKLKSRYHALGSVIKKQQEVLAQRANLRSQMVDAIALGVTLAAPLKVAIDFESAMADVKKVVEFTPNTSEATDFANKLKEMSRTIPLSAAELAQIAASGGQLGIAKEDLTKFTDTVAKMATAFDMTAEEAGDAIAKLSNVYNIGIDKMGKVGDVINHLSDNTAAKAREMVATLNIIGGTAKQFGLDVTQASSLANSFISLGKQPAKAATAINAMLSKLQTAGEQSSEFQETLEEMELSVEELEEAIKSNAQGALMKFLAALEKIDSQERSKILYKLFGLEYQDDIALLVGSLDKYKKAIELVAQERDYENSMQKEFDNRASTTANNLQLLKNSMAEVGMNLGAVMLPTLNTITGALKAISTSIAQFAERYPKITTAVVGVTTALIGFKIAAVGLGYALTFIKGGALALVAIMHGPLTLAFTKLASSVFPAVVLGLKTIALAVISNPIGIAVAGLVTGAALIISNWEKVKSFFASFWEYIKSIIKPIGEAFAWISNTAISPLKNTVSLFKKKSAQNTILKSVYSPLSSSTSKEFSKNNTLKNFKVNSVIEEKKFAESNSKDDTDKIFKEFIKSKFENKEEKTFNKTQHITNNYNISIKAEPNQDTCSLADEVIRRIREQARGALFDIVEEVY